MDLASLSWSSLKGSDGKSGYSNKAIRVFKQVAKACRRGSSANCKLVIAVVLDYKNSAAGSVERYSDYFYAHDEDPSEYEDIFLGNFDRGAIAKNSAELPTAVKNAKSALFPHNLV